MTAEFQRRLAKVPLVATSPHPQGSSSQKCTSALPCKPCQTFWRNWEAKAEEFREWVRTQVRV